jgi:hypothetical protein
MNLLQIFEVLFARYVFDYIGGEDNVEKLIRIRQLTSLDVQLSALKAFLSNLGDSLSVNLQTIDIRFVNAPSIYLHIPSISATKVKDT